jgi:serine/threonine protein kinase
MSKKVGQYLLTKDKLGEGAFSQVFRGELNGDESKQFAIKVIVKKSIVHDEYMVGSLLNEVSIMKKMSNQHIVKLEDVLETANNYYIVQELC